MKTHIHQLFLFSASVALLLLSSCASRTSAYMSVYQKTSPNHHASSSANSSSMIEHRIHESVAADNVGEMIQCYINYPNYRTLLSDHLIYDRDYSEEPYYVLLLYQQEAAKDSVLASFFEDIIHQREYQVLTRLSDYPLPKVADYYKKNVSEQVFLAPALRNTVLQNLDEYDYFTLHKLHQLFMDTEFSEDIERVYTVARKGVMVEVMKNLQELNKNELNVLRQYKKYCANEVHECLSNALQIFIEKLFKGDLPEGKNAIDNHFKKMLDEQIKERIELVVNSNISSCVDNVNKSRTSYLSTLMEGRTFNGYKMEREHTFVNLEINTSVCNPLYELSEIQNKTDWTGWGLTAASVVAAFFSYGLASLAIDAVDVGRSINNGHKEADKSKELIEKFVHDLSIKQELASLRVVENSFKAAESRLHQSQNNFKNIVNENY